MRSACLRISADATRLRRREARGAPTAPAELAAGASLAERLGPGGYRSAVLGAVSPLRSPPRPPPRAPRVPPQELLKDGQDQGHGAARFRRLEDDDVVDLRLQPPVLAADGAGVRLRRVQPRAGGQGVRVAGAHRARDGGDAVARPGAVFAAAVGRRQAARRPQADPPSWAIGKDERFRYEKKGTPRRGPATTRRRRRRWGRR